MFSEYIKHYSWKKELTDIYKKKEVDVRNALKKEVLDIDDFKSLVSPAAKPFLEEMAQKSHRLTKRRFGNTVQLYTPIYLSNECCNVCTYCGFSMNNKISRKILSEDEMIEEFDYLRKKGYQHLLLVTGEANHLVGVQYLKNAIRLAKTFFANISIEVQPLQTKDYQELREEGLYAVMVYQETYHKKEYLEYHLKGKKRNFEYRLDTPDRLGQSGVHKIGIGALFGLDDWRTDSVFTALHLRYLQKRYWKTKYSISFPRLRPFEGGVSPKLEMKDDDLVQLICAYRLFDQEVELSISTRESGQFRDHIVQLGATTLSAESRTNPGGYSVDKESLEQFEVSDKRTIVEIVDMLEKQGLDPVWRDSEIFI